MRGLLAVAKTHCVRCWDNQAEKFLWWTRQLLDLGGRSRTESCKSKVVRRPLPRMTESRWETQGVRKGRRTLQIGRSES